MSSLTRATESMSLEELTNVLQEHKANYRNLRESIYYMKRQVNGEDDIGLSLDELADAIKERKVTPQILKELLNRMNRQVDDATIRRERRRMGVLITAGMYNDGITVSKTLMYLKEFEEVLATEYLAKSNEIQRLSVLKDKVSDKYRVAKSLLEMIEAGQAPQAIESKMARDYSGEHKWKGILGPRDFMQVNLYFKNLEVVLIKNQAVATLKRIIEAVEPEDESKPKGVYNLEAIENKLEDAVDELGVLAILRHEVYKLTQATKRLRDILNSIAQ